MATIDTVKEVLVENLDLEADKITEEATLESLGIDSLDMVELICDLEEKCDVEFGEPEGIETVGQLVAHIDSLKAAGRKISKVQRPRPTNFYFTARPSASAREVEVVAPDRFGRRYSERIALGHTD